MSQCLGYSPTLNVEVKVSTQKAKHGSRLLKYIQAPIDEYSPAVHSLNPTVTEVGLAVFPFVPSTDSLREQMYQEQLLEWVGLTLIKSKRILEDDKVDPYICRYHLPEAFDEVEDTKTES